ncbi:MAG: 50S ribosomal protein L10 [Candidatus Aerophobetes bacterium]|nr:50S ribosomal protein L10 [Candidatus Aerophobetes bacterium]
MGLEQKIKQVKRIEKGLKESKASFMLDYCGLKVDEITDFRKKLRKKGEVEFCVVKNSLASRAAEKLNLEGINRFFSGPTGIVFVKNDPLASAKVLKEFLSEHPNLSIKGGSLREEILDKEKVKLLWELPGQKVLLSQLIAGMQFPLRRLVMVLNSPLEKLVYLLRAVLQERKGG